MKSSAQEKIDIMASSFSQALLDTITLCNNGRNTPLTPLFVQGIMIGLVPPTKVSILENYPDIFLKTKDSIILNPKYQTYRQRSAIFTKFLKELFGYSILKEWRNEELEVYPQIGAESLLRTERAGFSLLGMVTHGIHINGYTLNSENKVDKMWFGVRPAYKKSFPGKLDQMVAGVMCIHDSCMHETAVREGYEEAGLTYEDICRSTPCGSVSYFYRDQNYVFPCVRYVLDLELPSDFTPENKDGDVESFVLLSVTEAKQALIDKKFRFSSALVLIHFFIRHGVITPDNEPRYNCLLTWMHMNPFCQTHN